LTLYGHGWHSEQQQQAAASKETLKDWGEITQIRHFYEWMVKKKFFSLF
jgi:hypothetical protein